MSSRGVLGPGSALRGRLDRVGRAIRRPDLVWRRLAGRPVIEIGLDEIAPFLGDSPVVVEAGALNGDDTVRLAGQWPAGTVHAFEPVPGCYEDVVRRTASLSNVVTYQTALGRCTGVAPMFVSDVPGTQGARGGSSSLLRPTGHEQMFPEIEFAETVEVPVTTLDKWAEDVGVDQVDFAWLDLQGMELAVLSASPRVLGGLTAVCMEVSRRELYADGPLYPEVVAWMRSQGFTVVIDRVPVIVGNMLFVRR